ncbi:MAG TPA: DNA-3-methyladenine glycosylase [Gemmatimonadaceae bacterium]|nr:DNA-3-methyladenine glycosylase [Gemmatimonadaceae bacterium]
MPTRAAAVARRSRASGALPAKFYDRDTEQVARDLLGAVLRCTTANGVTSGRIVETEAYLGEHDLACHAAAGLTARTRWLYGAPGTAYVYFIYGVHWCFNAVTRAVGSPSAVLVRALEPLDGVELMRERRGEVRDRDLTNGPGKLCEALGITGALNGQPLRKSAIEILRGEEIPDSRVRVTPRIGITKSAEWPLRWYVADNAYVSKTPRYPNQVE